MSPSPVPRHQRAVGRLFLLLHEACTDDHELFVAPLDVVLANDTVIIPDLLVAPKAQFTDRDLPGPPTLMVEVLSPSTRGVDLLLKKARLQHAGCPHYWIVDPATPSFTAWTLKDGEYREAGRVEGTASLDLDAPFSVTVTPQALVEE